MPTKKKAYHRVQDLKRLREQALPLPLIISDNGRAYVVETDAVLDRQVLCKGRYQVVYEFLRGYAAGRRCDCGAVVTSCRDCAVSDYQAAHPDCAQCCQPAQGPRYD